MKTTSIALQVFYRSVGIGIVTLVLWQEFPVAAQDRSEKMRQFEADRTACRSGNSGQILESCMKEANAVLSQRRDLNPLVSPEQLQRNSLIRCEAFTGNDKTICAARIRGEGTASGTVAGGGVLRELVANEVVTKPPHKPASSSESK